MQSLQKTISVSDIPIECHPMKQLIHNSFKDLSSEGKLKLKHTKQNSLIDFISCIPDMTTKAAARENIVCGFIENGMIDRRHLRFPDFNKILSTCRLDPTKKEYELCINSFPYLYKEYLKNGHVSDEVFENLGFPMDRDVDGTLISHNANISQECRQRAKCLTHDHQINIRMERISLIEEEIKRKEADHIAQLQILLSNNKKCEEKICNLLGKQYDESYLKEVTHEVLDKCNGNELKSFILVRKTELPKSKLPQKGKIIDAIKGENNLLSIAFGCKEMNNIVKMRIENVEKNDQLDKNVNDIKCHTIELNICNNATQKTKASQFLHNKTWMKITQECFHGMAITNQINDELTKNADKLHDILLTRLSNHIHHRISDNKKRDHWCLKWEARNMAQMSSLMILMGHIKIDLNCLDNNTTLLKSCDNFEAVNDNHVNKQGAYLYFDTNNNSFIRSGKVTGREFMKRHMEHQKMAGSDQPTSIFYFRYPTMESTLSQSPSRKGYFDNLIQYVAIGFDIDNVEISKKLTTVLEDGGIFTFNEFEIKMINQMNMRGRATLMLKKIDLIAYLCEIVYDISISPIDNVSTNPGFESCLGIFS